TLIGASLAWLVVRTDIPGKGLFRTALTIPYLIPPFVGAIAWVNLLGPVGYLNQLYQAVTGAADPLFTIYGKWGIILVMIVYGYPIPYMVLINPLERMNAALEEAGRMSGASIMRVMRDITLPLMGPSIGAGALLLFMSLLANFGIPAVLGFPAGYYVLTTRIYSTIVNFGVQDNLRIAAALSMFLAVISFLGMGLQSWLLRKGTFTTVTGQSTQPQLVLLRQARWPAAAAVALFLILSTVAPLGGIVLSSLTKAVGVDLTWANITLKHYNSVLFGIPAIPRSIWNSVWLAATAAFTIAFIGAGLAYLIVKMRVKGGKLLSAVISVPYIVPGTVVALAFILAFIKPVMGISLYNTPWLLLFAYVARFMTYGVRTVGSSLEQIHDSLEEAARMSGGSPLRSFYDIVWPLIKPSMYATWFLVFIPSLTELTMSAILYSVGNETIGVMVFSFHQEGKAPVTAALSVVLVAMVFALNALMRSVSKDKLGF
ncbi:MAG TPA: iron ABC transporter permease, partial [Symbiobacteriaceae bacterium]|nr:iron ABC transporter permease [Symbiobacteriaceae bacterium]